MILVFRARSALIVAAFLSLVIIGWYQYNYGVDFVFASAKFVKCSDNSGFNYKNQSDFLRRRLEEAESIWRKGVVLRNQVEILSPLSETNPWSMQGGLTIWDYFYPNFNCPHMVERLGRSGDGGKWVCGISHLSKYAKSDCSVYSFGVGSEVSFERDILARTNCSLHLYDHTVNISNAGAETIDTRIKMSRGSFSKLGLGFTNSGPLRTLKSEMENREDTFIEILKVDIEGWEFDAFQQILQDFPDQLPFGQLLIEIHLDHLSKTGLYQQFKKWWEALEGAGLRAFRNEINLIGLLGGSREAAYYEVSFINIRGGHTLLHY